VYPSEGNPDETLEEIWNRMGVQYDPATTIIKRHGDRSTDIEALADSRRLHQRRSRSNTPNAGARSPSGRTIASLTASSSTPQTSSGPATIFEERKNKAYRRAEAQQLEGKTEFDHIQFELDSELADIAIEEEREQENRDFEAEMLLGRGNPTYNMHMAYWADSHEISKIKRYCHHDDNLGEWLDRADDKKQIHHRWERQQQTNKYYDHYGHSSAAAADSSHGSGGGGFTGPPKDINRSRQRSLPPPTKPRSERVVKPSTPRAQSSDGNRDARQIRRVIERVLLRNPAIENGEKHMPREDFASFPIPRNPSEEADNEHWVSDEQVDWYGCLPPGTARTWAGRAKSAMSAASAGPIRIFRKPPQGYWFTYKSGHRV